jgi:hypothetical protein
MADFNIPTNVYSWSGLPKEHREGLLSSLMPQLTKAATEYPQIVPQYMNRQMRQYGDVAKTAGQGLLNQLAGRNMLGGSKPAIDAGSQLMKELNQQRFGQLADMEFQSKMAYPSMLSELVGLGKATEQPFEPYQAIVDLIKTLY